MAAKHDDDRRRHKRRPVPVAILIAGVIGVIALMWLLVSYSGMLSF